MLSTLTWPTNKPTRITSTLAHSTLHHLSLTGGSCQRWAEGLKCSTAERHLNWGISPARSQSFFSSLTRQHTGTADAKQLPLYGMYQSWSKTQTKDERWIYRAAPTWALIILLVLAVKYHRCHLCTSKSFERRQCQCVACCEQYYYWLEEW